MSDGAIVQFTDLQIASVDPDSPVPLYHQIEIDLRRLIREGLISPKDTLPPELELCKAYGVGRQTVRMALSRLVADDLITRRAGIGTIVKPRADRMKFYLDRSFTQQMAEMGRQAHSKVIKAEIDQFVPECPGVFANKIGADYFHLIRLRFGDNEPIALQASVVLLERCPGLERQDFEVCGLYDVLAREYRFSITEIQHSISAEVANETQAQLLGITEGDPLLVVNTTAFLDDGQVVEHTISHYRADQYEFRTKHTYAP